MTRIEELELEIKLLERVLELERLIAAAKVQQPVNPWTYPQYPPIQPWQPTLYYNTTSDKTKLYGN